MRAEHLNAHLRFRHDAQWGEGSSVLGDMWEDGRCKSERVSIARHEADESGGLGIWEAPVSLVPSSRRWRDSYVYLLE